MKNKQRQYRSEGITLVLAAVLGLIGICGIGHIYVGRLARGFVLLFGSVAIGVAGFLMGVMFLWFPEFVFVPLAAYLGFYVWTVFDARSVVKKHNESLDDAGGAEAAGTEAGETEAAKPEPTESEEAEPVAAGAEQPEPEEAEPVADAPEDAEPETAETEPAESGADKPEAAETETGKPEPAESEVAKHEEAEPVADAPEPAKPDGDEPDTRK